MVLAMNGLQDCSELRESNCTAEAVAFPLVSVRAVRLRLAIAALALGLVLAACGSDAADTPVPTSAAQGTQPAASCTPAPAGGDSFTQSVAMTTTTADGLKYGDIVVGTGAAPNKGDNLTMQYTGWLTNGCVFDTSRQAGRSAFQFVIGATPANVIAGWEEGILTMHVGGKRRLVIPPALGYGASGQGPIPPNSTLIFDVELLAIGGPSPT
jgi:peptidylprolyl isomerase